MLFVQKQYKEKKNKKVNKQTIYKYEIIRMK